MSAFLENFAEVECPAVDEILDAFVENAPPLSPWQIQVLTPLLRAADPVEPLTSPAKA